MRRRKLKKRHRLPRRARLRIHANRRFDERLEMTLTDELHDEIVGRIQTWRALHLDKISNTRSLFKVTARGRRFRVVYDKKWKTLVTALPETKWGMSPEWKES